MPPGTTESREAPPAPIAVERLPLGSLTVRVADPGGRPVPEFGVVLFRLFGAPDPTRPPRPVAVARESSGADGTARFPGVPPGLYEVAPEEAGPFLGSDPSQVVFGPTPEAKEIRLRVPRLAEIRGRVVDADGEGVEEARVDLHCVLTGRGSWSFGDRATGPGGAFSIRNVPVEEGAVARLRARHPDFLAPASLEAVLTEARSIDVGFLVLGRRAAAVRGRTIFPDGETAPQIRLMAMPTSGAGNECKASSGLDGAFEIRSLGPGGYQVTSLSHRMVPLSVEVEDPPSDLDVGDVVVERNEALLLGRVRDGRGAPAAGAKVTAGLHEVRARDDGTFEILARDTGPYTVLVEWSPEGDAGVPLRSVRRDVAFDGAPLEIDLPAIGVVLDFTDAETGRALAFAGAGGGWRRDSGVVTVSLDGVGPEGRYRTYRLGGVDDLGALDTEWTILVSAEGCEPVEVVEVLPHTIEREEVRLTVPLRRLRGE